MTMKRLIYWCEGVILCCYISGCVTAVVGVGAAGSVAYLKGDLESTEPYHIDRVYRASKKALDDFGITVLQDAKDALSAKIVARDAQDQKITIRLQSESEKSTKLSIRISVFGSEQKSQRIYNKIREYL